MLLPSAHQGKDGSGPWERVRHVCPDLSEGNQIIGNGRENVRTAEFHRLNGSEFPAGGHRRMA
jgi:hypothetical protein